MPTDCELIVDSNDAARRGDPTHPKRGFLFYDHIVEVYFTPSSPHARRVAVVTGFLLAMRERGLKAVPACDYEDELPAP